MKKPESHDPTNTMKAAHQWPLRPRRCSPNRNSPRNADSRKNENTPSIASGCAITPPVACENRDQFVPNWNSMGMPVTTPATKLMPKIFVQKRAASSYIGLLVRSPSVLKATISGARPMVSCGKR